MLKRMVLPAALLISTLGVTLAPSAAAANRNDFGRGGESNRVVNSYSYGYNNNYRETSNSREWRERQERDRRVREWRERERRGRGFGERDYYRR